MSQHDAIQNLNAHRRACVQCADLVTAALPEQRWWIDLASMCPVGRTLYKRWWQGCYCRPYPPTLEDAIETPAPME